MRAWLRSHWTIPLFLVLVVVAYADPLFRPRSFGGRDLTPYNYPTESAVHDAYARGRLPVWEADISGGRPLLPNPNAGALYPVRWLLSPLAFPVAMRIYPVLHWILAGAGMLVLLGRLGASREAAWIAAVTYVFSGVSVAEVFYLHIQPGMMLLPWILWAVVAGEGRVRDAALLGLLFALDMLAGDIFTVGLAVLCAGLWIVSEEPSGQILRRLGILSLGIGLGALVAAPQILATILWIPETNRAVLGMRLLESFYYSVSPWRLLEFLVPYPFGDVWTLDDSAAWGQSLYRGKTMGLFSTLYVGALPLFVLLVTARDRARGLRWARRLCAISLAIAVIPSLMPLSWLALRSPIPLRNPEKVVVAAVFGLSVLTGLGLEPLRARRAAFRWALPVGAGLCVAALVAALFPARIGRIAAAAIGGPEKASLAGHQLPGALAQGGIFWMATLGGAVALGARSRAARIGAIGLLSLVPIAAHRRIAQTFREEEVMAPTAFARLLDRQDPDRRFRVLGLSIYRASSPGDTVSRSSDPSFNEWTRITWTEHTQALWKRGTIFNFDFDNGDLSRVDSLRRVARRSVGDGDPRPLFASLGLRWEIRFADQDPLPGYVRFGGNLLLSWDECAQALPTVRLLDRWQETEGSVESLRGLLIAPAVGPFLDTGRRRPGASSGGRVTLLENSPERLRADIEASQPGWIFVLRAFWSQRDVLLDGRPAQVVPAQLAFSAVAVPPGVHRLDWRERVPGWKVSRWGPVLFLLMIGGIWLRGRGARSRE